MISNPVTVANDSVRALFSASSFPYAFGFAGGLGYQQDYTMENGAGFWGKFPTATVNLFTGAPRPVDSIAVVAGWNIVGSVTGDVDTATITSSVPGLGTSPWYGYSEGYSAVSTIQQGKGYWKKASGTGKFYFAGGTGMAARPAMQSRLGSSPQDAMNTVTITDSKGGFQTLYFGAGMDNATAEAYYQMPPVPPVGAFDARFESAQGGLMLRAHPSQVENVIDLPIAIQSEAYPLTVSWKIKTGSYTLRNVAGDQEFAPKSMTGEGSLKITNSLVNKLNIRVTGWEQLPREYALHQNFPNPFNPSTTIRFQIPQPGLVSLTVFDVLGREVATLVNEHKPAGEFTVHWDAAAMSSGMYFYRLESDGRREIKKMLLMK